MKKRSYISILLVLITWMVAAQSFPIRVNTFLNPPYSPRISDFGKAESTSLMAQLQLTDLSLTSLDVRLLITIQGNGITIKTNPSYVPNTPITLQAGAIVNLTGADLANYLNPDNLIFQGYSQQQFRRTGEIPEGFYEISFQAVEYRRGNSLSNPNPPIRGIGWFKQNDVPWIVYPEEGDSIIGTDPQNIVFQWQPRHIGTPGANFVTEYTFQLVEIWNQNGDINNAFLTTNILFETTTQATSFAYTVAEPPLEYGRKYAIRVQAREFDPAALPGVSEGSLFKNNGYSQVVSFTYLENCQAPYGVNASVQGSDLIQIDWIPQYNHQSVDIHYKIIGGNGNTYTKSKQTGTTVFLDHFQPEQLVEYRVRGNCQNNSSGFSIPQTIQLPKNTIRYSAEEAASSNGCGDEAGFLPFNPTTEEPLGYLQAGDIIKTTSENIKVLEVFGGEGNGWFKGKGQQEISPWNLTGRGTFNIQVNKNYEMLDGIFEITGGNVAPIAGYKHEDILVSANLIRSLVSEADLKKLAKKNEGGGLPIQNVVNILDDAVEATGEALTKIPEAAKDLPQETIDVMEKLHQESKELLKEAEKVAEESPEKASELAQQAGEKLEEVANTLSSLPGIEEGVVDLVSSLGEAGADEFRNIIRETLEEIRKSADALAKLALKENKEKEKGLASSIEEIDKENQEISIGNGDPLENGFVFFPSEEEQFSDFDELKEESVTGLKEKKSFANYLFVSEKVQQLAMHTLYLEKVGLLVDGHLTIDLEQFAQRVIDNITDPDAMIKQLKQGKVELEMYKAIRASVVAEIDKGIFKAEE